MKMYRYETTYGEAISSIGRVFPRETYDAGFPILLFLTKNPVWEPTVLSTTGGRHKVTKNSPTGLSMFDIDCWRFTVEVKEPLNKLMYIHKYWMSMFEQAAKMGSNISEWHWTTDSFDILEAHTWDNGWTSINSETQLTGK